MKTVPFDLCACGKRGWYVEEDAEKALGRARAKRNRQHDKASASRRGMVRENRIYLCDAGDMYHLTSQSRRENQAQQAEVAERTLSWEQYLSGQGSRDNVVYLSDLKAAA